jgi:hypothetical protein
MRDVQNAIATTLDDFELVLEAFHKPTCVPIKKGVCYVVKVFFSCGHQAIKATELARSSRVPPFPHLALSLSFAQRRIKYRCAFMTEFLSHFQARRMPKEAAQHVLVLVCSLLFRRAKRPHGPFALTIGFF